MADSDKVILLKIEVAQAQANANIKKLEASLNNLDGRTKEYTLTLKKLQLERAKLNELRKNSSKEIQTHIKSLDQTSKSTGAATSATLELGRVFSDAPYGIRGVANNLSQLASQFSFMSNKVDKATGKMVGFNGALKQFGQAIKANAVLLLIQAVISAFDFFSNRVNETDKALTSLAESGVNESITELTLLKKALEDNSVPLEKKKKLIKGAREEYEDFNKAIKETPDELVATVKALDLLIQKYKDFARAKALTELVTDAMKNQAKILTKYKGDWTDMFVDFKSFFSSVGSAISGKGLGIGGQMTAELKESQKSIRMFEEMLGQKTKSDPTKTYLELIYGSSGKDKSSKGKISPFKTPEELQLDVESSISAIDKLAKQTELIQLNTEEKARLSMVKSEEDKTFIKEEYANRRLDITEKYEKKAMNAKADADIKSARDSYNTYIKKIDKEVVAFEAKLRKDGKALTKAEQKMLTDAKKVASDKKENAKTELTDTIILIEAEYGKLFPFWEQMAAARRAAIGTGKDVDTEKEFTLEEGLQQYMKLQSSMTDFLSGEYDRQLTIEQNKTNALNNELNQRLLNENLSKDERERIQLQIARNDEKLRKKQEAIEKKRFKLNKAANIANATINTYLGATQVLSSDTIPDVAKPFVMAATIASGLLQVAKIARQKFQSSAGSGGAIGAAAGRSGGGGEGREFNFNLAGSTQSNQLTQSIAGQLSQPIQAYVVSSEITSQQQLDLSISNTATIG